MRGATFTVHCTERFSRTGVDFSRMTEQDQDSIFSRDARCS